MSKLLIIDDDQLVANIYRNKFTVDGYEVEVALDGEEGLEQISKFKPDAVVLDLVLPKLAGVDLLKKVRAGEGDRKLPIIVFSNTYLSSTIQEAWKAGATKCLSKSSCTPQQLLEVVGGALSSGSQESARAQGTAGKPPTPSQPDPASTRPGINDSRVQEQVRNTFLGSLNDTLMVLRTQLHGMVKAPDEETRLKLLEELHRKVHIFSSNAGMAGLKLIAQLGEVYEALIKELLDRPSGINPSTLRTLASAIDFLGWLFEHGTDPRKQDLGTPKVLVVDDEPLSRKAVAHAMERAHLPSTCLEDPNFAAQTAAQNRFSLIILDVDMPGMNGFELCSKLRAMHLHKQTPIIFVTNLTDFESRANSTTSGGNDLIAKPFLFTELALKALMHLMRGRLAAKG